MGILYSADAMLDLKHEKINLEYLFQKCIENNIYLYIPFGGLNELDSNNATARILSVEIEDDEHYIHAKFQDTDFSIWIFKKNNLIIFSIGNFGITWKKEFINDDYGIDFARYIRLLLRVCKDFTILALETSAI